MIELLFCIPAALLHWLVTHKRKKSVPFLLQVILYFMKTSKAVTL